MKHLACFLIAAGIVALLLSAQSTQLPGGSQPFQYANTVRNGSGAPSSVTGNDGDFYIDRSAIAIYGPKTSGAWGMGTSLIGAAGTPSFNSSDDETPSGSGTSYSLAHAPYPPASLVLVKNGMVLDQGQDFTLLGETITFINGTAPINGDLLHAWYRY